MLIIDEIAIAKMDIIFDILASRLACSALILASLASLLAISICLC